MKPGHKKEVPIFLDVSGHRWRMVKLWLSFLIIACSAFTIWIGARILSPNNAADVAMAASADLSLVPWEVSSIDKLADTLSRTNVPVIGQGPLVRLVKVQNDKVSEVFKGGSTRQLTKAEQVTVGEHQYALEWYGATSGGKRLVLTFDDGPDLVYTARILDLLSSESVPATFFLLGNSIIKYPEVAARIAREGHDVANHSFTHIDFEVTPSFAAEQEINLTQRVLRRVTQHDSKLFRPPYVGNSDQSLRDSLRGIMHGQKQGYVVALFDFDTSDWRHATDHAQISMPPFDGQDHVLLLHDGGGKRDATLSYLQKLIQQAKQNGYTFTTLSALYPSNRSLQQTTSPSLEDTVFTTASQAVLVWPVQAMSILFTITVVFVFFGMGVYVVLAVIQNRRTARDARLLDSAYRPSVAILVPAYNEEKVLGSCIKSLLESTYKNIKIYIIDDGSTDNTLRVAQKLARTYRQVKVSHQPNGGKASAMNRGIKRTQCQIIIGIDADTHFMPDTISRLIRHFADQRVGAVAGSVKVGNRSNILARCQALEYAASISLERTAQAFMGAIMVVPGACGAWRRQAIIDAGRYSSVTLAEDCDLTMAVHMAGYRVVQDNTATAQTEVPTTLRAFARQRFRWAFGNVQVYWKYQNVLLSHRRVWLDSFVLPMAIISTVGPLFFLPLLGAIFLSNLISGQYLTLLLFMTISFCFQFFKAWVGLALGREKSSYLWLVPVSRMLYGPLRVYLVYATVLRAFQGAPVGWNKLTRVGMVTQPPVLPRTRAAIKT